MEAEVQALVHVFDYAFLFRYLVSKFLRRALELEAMKYYKTVLNDASENGKTTERHLQIDAMALRQIYDMGKPPRKEWITVAYNSADPLTNPFLST